MAKARMFGASTGAPAGTKSKVMVGRAKLKPAAQQWSQVQRPVQVSSRGGSDKAEMTVAEQKIALGKLLEKKRKNDLRGMLKAQREGTLNEYLKQDMIRIGISAAAFSGV
jgi:hypothetical protein